MRFDRLTLERYGHFAERPLDLGSDTRLAVVLGPNEAGKTTILQAIRDLVVGMPHQSDYNFRFGYDGMRVHASLQDAHGARIEVIRSRGGKQIEGRRSWDGQDEALDDGAWKALLGGMTRERYEALFAITLGDLQQGRAALERVGLAQLLAGGALGRGGRQVVEARERLEEQMDALFRPRAQKKPVNEALRRLRDAEGDTRKARLSQTAWRELRRAQDDADRRHSALAKRAGELQAHVSTRERWLGAWPDVERLRRLDERLADERLDVSLAPAAAEEILDDVQRVRGDDERRLVLDRKVDELEEQAAELNPDARLLEEGAAIEALVRRLDATRERRSAWPERSDAIAEEREAVLAEARRVLPVEDLDALARWGLETSTRERIDHLAGRHEALSADLEEARRGLEDAKERLAEEEARLDDLGAATVDDGLTRLSDEVAAVRDDHTDWRRSAEEAERLRAEVARGRAVLHPAWPRETTPEEAPLPGREAVRTRVEERRALEGERDRLASDLEAARSGLRRIEDQLEELLREREPPTGEELAAARDERDGLWGVVEAAWLDDATPGTSPRQLASDYRRAVDGADAVADRLRSEAKDVAAREALEAQRGRTEQSVAEGEETLQEAEDALAEWTARWERFWADLGVEADGPEVMAEWLEDARGIQERARRAVEAEERSATLRERVAPVEARLREVLDEAEDASWAVLTGALGRRLEEQRVRSTARDVAEQRKRDLGKDIRTRERRRKELKADLEALAEETEAAASRIGFEDRPAAPDLLDRIVRAEGLAERAQRAVATADEVRRIGEALEAFDAEVERILAAVGRDAEGRPPEVMVERLQQELSEARDGQARRETAEEELKRLRADRDALMREVDALGERLAEQRRRAGVEDDEALADLARRALERRDLEVERREVDDRITERLGAGEEREEAMAALRAASREALEAEIRTLREDELARVTRERDEVARELGSLSQEMKALGGDRAAVAAAEAEEARSELEDHAASWLRLATARLVLDRVVARYAEEHQGSLLAHTSRVFERLTGGRYTRVVQPLGRDAILVESADGGLPKEPKALSTGTREQLFLALRLAYVLEHADQHEPLPVVLDDVLVNFDPERTDAALASLTAVGESCQVVLLTCHPHVAEMAKAHGDGVRVVTLEDA